jgi:hypothetical protein
MANDAAVEQQYGHLEAKLPCQLRVGVDVDDGNRGDRPGALEIRQRGEHIFTEVTAVSAQDHEAAGKRHRRQLYLGRGDVGARLNPSATDASAFEALTCLAISSTVLGGTSPTAVT